jgi:hypothetical protein
MSATANRFPPATSGEANRDTLPTARTLVSTTRKLPEAPCPAWLFGQARLRWDYELRRNRLRCDFVIAPRRTIGSGWQPRAHLGCCVRGGHNFARTLPPGTMSYLRRTARERRRGGSVRLGKLFSRRSKGRICFAMHREAPELFADSNLPGE